MSAQLGPLKSTWTYDAVGNRSKQTSPLGAITYTYDVGDRLLAAGTATFTYDANGNQTSVAKTFSSQPLIYQYDAANRLVAVTGGRTNSTFAFDGDGNRISQSVGTGIYNYLNDVATALPVVLCGIRARREHQLRIWIGAHFRVEYKIRLFLSLRRARQRNRVE